MQRKAAFFGSRVDKLNMIIVFSIALFFSASNVQAGREKPTDKPKGRIVPSNCCPTKLCYNVNISPEEKMEFIITQTTCTCEPVESENCMKTFRDIEFSISKLHRIYEFGKLSNTRSTPASIASVPVAVAPAAPTSLDATTKAPKCCVTKLCLEVAYQPRGTILELVVALTPTTCTCSSVPGISCLESFEEIENASRNFVNAKYILGF